MIPCYIMSPRIYLLFTIGELTEIILANTSQDRVLHDINHVVALFHDAPSIEAVFTVIEAFGHWLPLFSCYILNSAGTEIHFVMVFVGINITFFPHFLDSSGIPQYSHYPDAYTIWNTISSIGSFTPLMPLILTIFIIQEAFASQGEAPQ